MFQKIFTFLSLSLVLVGGFFVNFDGNTLGGVSFSVETYAATGGTMDADMQKMINQGITYMNGAIEVMTVVVSPAIFLASWLMTPDWTSGDLFNLRPVLHNLWILVSNVTYFIYALLLIFIALATIFNSQNYGYKKLLPRLALGIILVPLTWWFVQFIISLATIVTASVINLPMEVVQNNAVTNGKTDAWWSDPTIHNKYQFFTDDFDKILFGGASQEKKCDSATCKTPKQVLTDASGVYSALLVYGHGVFKIGEAKNLKGSIDVAKTGMSILNQLIIGTIMFVIFGFLVIALVFLLFMRAIKLWFYAIFSPLMTLRYVIGDGLFGKDNADGFEIKEFIGLAFVPALVGLALSFGLMIVTVLQNAGSKPGNPISCNSTDIASDKGCAIGNLAGNPKNTIISKVVDPNTGKACGADPCLSLTILTFGGIEFEYYGGIVGKDAAATNVNDTRGTLNSLGGMFGILIIDMISIIFIWTAFMAAKNVSKVAQAVIKPFEDMGKKVGSLAKDLPKYTPIPGTGGNGSPGWSLKSADKAFDLAESKFRTHKEEEANQTIGKAFPGLVKGIIPPKTLEELENVAREQAKSTTGMKEVLKKFASTEAGFDDTRLNHKNTTDRVNQPLKENIQHLDSTLLNTVPTSPERDLLKKYYLGENLTDEDRKKARGYSQQYFGSAGSDGKGGNNTSSLSSVGTNNQNNTLVSGNTIVSVDAKVEAKKLAEQLAIIMKDMTDITPAKLEEKLKLAGRSNDAGAVATETVALIKKQKETEAKSGETAKSNIPPTTPDPTVR